MTRGFTHRCGDRNHFILVDFRLSEGAGNGRLGSEGRNGSQCGGGEGGEGEGSFHVVCPVGVCLLCPYCGGKLFGIGGRSVYFGNCP